MFEELDSNNQTGVNSQSAKPAENLFEKNTSASEKKVDDIFSDTEPIQKPAILQPKSAAQTANDILSAAAEDKRRNLRNLLYLTVAALVLLAMAIGGYFFVINLLNRNNAVEDTLITNEPAGENINSDNNKVEEVVPSTKSNEDENQPASDNNAILEDEASKDTDQDGLLDSEEAGLGTDINSVDTDGDGLFDREEVKIYKTDPLNPDTDGDTYNDGEEVKGGYNPNGAGKLFELPQ